ncbi:MAG: hypothetical protein ACRD7E_16025 [Bryobacteraceae bacterium]
MWLAHISLIALLSAPASGSDLSIVNSHIHDYEDSPPVSGQYKFRAGEPVFVSFQIDHYGVTGDEQIHLTYQIRTVDPQKRSLAPPQAGEIKAQLAPEDKEWMPKVRYRVQIPPIPEPGEYTVTIDLDDKVAQTKTTRDLHFHVESKDVAASEGLAVLNFRFARTEEARDALPPGGAYRPGDTLWARFDITGYRFGEKNRYDVRYGVALKDAEGKVLFSEPKAAQASEESFYPKQHVPGSLSLKLDKNIRPGVYSVVLTVEDAVGGQKIETGHSFSVEK